MTCASCGKVKLSSIISCGYKDCKWRGCIDCVGSHYQKHFLKVINTLPNKKRIEPLDNNDFFNDCLHIFHYLKYELPAIAKANKAWVDKSSGFPTVGNRLNINNGNRPMTVVFGSDIFRKGKFVEPVGNKRYRELWEHIQYVHKKYFSSFHSFTQCVINYNTPFSPHKDKANKNDETLIFAVGDYTGGELNIEGTKYDIAHTPLLFNGRENLHWVEPIHSGDRYSLVFYDK